MEILLCHFFNRNYIKFKIDLIVWKYRKISRKNRNTNRFKIDLIVWKCEFIEEAEQLDLVFKIDLIVWKWSSLSYLNHVIYSLK